MKTSLQIVEDFVGKLQSKGLKVFFSYPPISESFPYVTFYQVGVLSDSPDNEMRETAFTFAFDIWSDEARSCYEIEATIDSAFKELPYRAEKLGAVDRIEESVYRKVLTYRFHWNF